MKLLAYVSDESYVAMADVVGEFASHSTGEVTCFRSTPTGAFRGDIPDGPYSVTLAREGYGSKSLVCEFGGEPLNFRLMSNRLLGYVWPKWTRGGEKGELRLHSPGEFQLSLWRYGLHKEFVRIISWFDEHGPNANLQILPDADFSQTGVAWNRVGYPSLPLTNLVDAPSCSGLYYFWARTPDGAQFSFPWVVAPAKPQTRIAVLASTNTWNAYNNFGGRSNYINPDGLPPRPTVNARQDLGRYTPPAEVWSPCDEDFLPLSFDRPEPANHIFDATPWNNRGPEDPVQGRMQCGQAPGEWRLLAWLEREGFDYEYYADEHLHDGSLQLNRYPILVLPVHPEYWTREMYLRVKNWVRDGGKLVYLGGNGLNCEVLLDDGAMRCLSHVNSLRYGLGGSVAGDPSRRYDSRMHRTLESEANLLGIACSDAGIMTAAPYRVLQADHWAFDKTGLATGDLFGTATLHERITGGASGHETDKITSHSPREIEHLAKGENPEEGGADLVYYRNEKGGEVFSVGSMTWVAALFCDSAISRITSNVLTRFLK